MDDLEFSFTNRFLGHDWPCVNSADCQSTYSLLKQTRQVICVRKKVLQGLATETHKDTNSQKMSKTAWEILPCCVLVLNSKRKATQSWKLPFLLNCMSPETSTPIE